jgi:hypothetical protein
MELFSLQTETADYNAIRTESGEWKLAIRYKNKYKDQTADGDFKLPKNWSAIRLFQFIDDLDNVNGR